LAQHARRILVAALAAWVTIVVVAWIVDGPLGHDEAAYAIGGELLLRGEPSPWLYRSVGMHALAAIGVAAGGADAVLRVPAILGAIGFLLAVYYAGRRMLGASVGAWGAAVVVGMHGLALRANRLESDLPSAACLLVGTAVLVGELERARATDGSDGSGGGVRWRVVATAPWLAAAFYLRYASCVPIALVGMVAAVVWWRAIAARPLPVVATIAALVTLLVPHALHALAETGSPLGIITFSSGVPRREYVGEGLVTYLTDNPFTRYGVLAVPVMVVGLASIALSPTRARGFVWLVAVGQVVALGLVSHATARYVYFALVLLVLLGVDGIARLATRRPWGHDARVRVAAVALVALAWIGVLVTTLGLSRREDWREPVVEAARIVRADAQGRRCHVVSRRFTQVMWYAKCDAGDQTPPRDKLERGELVYRVWVPRSLGTPELSGIPDATPVPLSIVELGVVPGRYEVHRITRR
jgi:hypothetical protein